MILMLNLILSVIFAGLIHELGHFIIALGYGHFLRFEFSWGHLWRIPYSRDIFGICPRNLPIDKKGMWRWLGLAG